MMLAAVPRTLVKTYLHAVRLPLTAVEKVRGTESDSWPPAMLFETFEAKALGVAGSILRDPALADEARLQTARVAQLKRAAELEAQAEATRTAADAKLEADREAAEARRRSVEEQAAERERRLEQEKAEEQRRVAEQARTQAEAARKADAARQKAVTSKERTAKLTKLTEDQAALAKRRQAAAAAGTVIAVDDALEKTKARRKNG